MMLSMVAFMDNCKRIITGERASATGKLAEQVAYSSLNRRSASEHAFLGFAEKL
jgi:hypothetical protein